MDVVLGIDVKQMYPISHIYMLLKRLDLSSSGRLSNKQYIPKCSLLIPILGTIIQEGNLSSEEI